VTAGAADVRSRVEAIRGRIEAAAKRAGRGPGDILLIAVSKGQPPERLLEARKAGVTVFGENYLQEAESKVAAIPGAAWHFIGRLQGNKVKKAVSLFSCIQTVDSERLAGEISRRAVDAGCVVPVLVEVNLGCEWSKAGVAPEGLSPLVASIAGLPGIRLSGLMAIPPVAAVPGESRPHFARMKGLLAAAREAAGPAGGGMTELSMGMSGDFEVAIEEGATMVRIGTALFGERPGRQA
jgi:pyridoxal phosphate enzyme (YggS family)